MPILHNVATCNKETALPASNAGRQLALAVFVVRLSETSESLHRAVVCSVSTETLKIRCLLFVARQWTLLLSYQPWELCLSVISM